MRLRLNSKTACRTTMPPWFFDITYWDVSFGTNAVPKVLSVRLLIAEKLNYIMTSLRGKKIWLRLKLQTACTCNYNATLIH